jgi:hypothetical protein
MVVCAGHPLCAACAAHRRNAAATWLGATMGYAECHDHKYAPYTQKDFYCFSAFFSDLNERGFYGGSDVEPPDRHADGCPATSSKTSPPEDRVE